MGASLGCNAPEPSVIRRHGTELGLGVLAHHVAPGEDRTFRLLDIIQKDPVVSPRPNDEKLDLVRLRTHVRDREEALPLHTQIGENLDLLVEVELGRLVNPDVELSEYRHERLAPLRLELCSEDLLSILAGNRRCRRLPDRAGQDVPVANLRTTSGLPGDRILHSVEEARV